MHHLKTSSSCALNLGHRISNIATSSLAWWSFANLILDLRTFSIFGAFLFASFFNAILSGSFVEQPPYFR
jgi:hypothetical protein